MLPEARSPCTPSMMISAPPILSSAQDALVLTHSRETATIGDKARLHLPRTPLPGARTTRKSAPIEGLREGAVLATIRLLIAIVFRTARIKLAERDEARQQLIKGQRPRDSNDDRASELVQRSAQGRPLTARTEPA